MQKMLLFLALFFSFFNNSISQNWMPLEKGNRWHYLDYREYGYNATGVSCEFGSIEEYQAGITIIDTVITWGKKYYRINGFYDFPNGTLIRYEDSILYVRQNNTDNVFMDFSKNDGDYFQQIQNDGTYYQVQVVSKEWNTLGKKWNCKGFSKTTYPSCYQCYFTGNYYFADGFGIIGQDEFCNVCWLWRKFWRPMEALLNFPDSTKHITGNYIPQILFTPTTFTSVPVLDLTVQVKYNFEVHYDVPFIYTESVDVEGYYKKGQDSILYTDKFMTYTSFQTFQSTVNLDTTLYKQGYRYYYRIKTKDKGIIPNYFYAPGDSHFVQVIWQDSLMYAPDESNQSKMVCRLQQNYPNPFNPITTIEYELLRRSFVNIKVYNVLGVEVAELLNEEKNGGSYKVVFNGDGLPSGIYFCSLTADSYKKTLAMTLIK